MIATFQAQLTSKVRLTDDVYFFRFDLTEPKEIKFSPGQYLILSIPQAEGLVKRLYSIASPSNLTTGFELIIKIVPGGTASTYLTSLKVGDKASFEGPAGVFTLKESDKDKIFLVTGTGIAPARSIIISNIKYQKSNIHSKYQKSNSQLPIPNYYLFWGLPYLKEVFLFDEFKRLAEEHPNFHFQICLSRETDLGAVKEEDKKYFTFGHVDGACDRLLQQCSNLAIKKSINDFDFHLCGDRQVVESLRKYLQSKGVGEGDIIFEKF